MTTTLLIVEDEPDIRETLEEIFVHEGWTVEIACDGAEALERLNAGLRPDVILLDLLMPRMSGEELYAAMQQDAALADIPVVVSTCEPDHAPRGVPVLRKPTALDRLITTVTAASGPLPCAGTA